MNKNNIIGLLIIGAIFVGWSMWMTPSKEELARNKFVQDSTAREFQTRQIIADSIARLRTEQQRVVEPQAEVITSSANDVSGVQVDRSKYSVFANSAVAEEKVIKVETDVLKLEFTNKGGRVLSAELKDYKTFDGQPLILFDSDTTKFNISFFVGNHLLNTQDFYFQTFWNDVFYEGKNEISVNGEDELKFGLRLYVDADDASYNPNKYIEYLYTIKGDNYMVDYDINFVGMKDVISPNADFLNLEWALDLRKQEKVSDDRMNGQTVYYKYLNDDVDFLSENKDAEEELNSKVKWISYKQRFFTTSIIAKENFTNAEVKTFNNEGMLEDDHYLRSMHSTIGLPYKYGIDQSIPLSFYFGPNKFNVLKKYKLELEKQIPLGWSFFLLAWVNIYAVIPVFNFLGGFGWNYGIIILVLTILLKLVLFPIAYKTYKSTAKMRVLKPEIDELNKKYPKKEDSMKKQQATMALYKKAGVNPMAGCVPMLLQMPILFAMFRFFPSSIELRQQPFLWATDLSSYDSIWTFPNGFSIPFYGDHISLFTLLMTVSTIFYTKLNNQMMASNQQMPGMKTMMYMMPIMFLGIFNNYASGLSYYYLLANLITFGQMYLIRQTINEKKILAQIEINKKKPAKKSKFQQRLAEAQKQRGIKPKR